MKNAVVMGSLLGLGLLISAGAAEAKPKTSASFYERYKDSISDIPLPSCAERSTELDRTEIQMILFEHNRARRDAEVHLPRRAKALPVVQWDCAAAEVAQEWADGPGDARGHSTSKWRQQRYGRRTGLRGNRAFLGENLAWAASTGAGRVGPAYEGVIDWDAERDDYNHSSNRCRSGKVCGHYTQIIWRESTKVGCGVKRDQIRFPNSSRVYPYGYFLSCTYHNRGNINGDNPLIEHPAFYYR